MTELGKEEGVVGGSVCASLYTNPYSFGSGNHIPSLTRLERRDPMSLSRNSQRRYEQVVLRRDGGVPEEVNTIYTYTW